MIDRAAKPEKGYMPARNSTTLRPVSNLSAPQPDLVRAVLSARQKKDLSVSLKEQGNGKDTKPTRPLANHTARLHVSNQQAMNHGRHKNEGEDHLPTSLLLLRNE